MSMAKSELKAGARKNRARTRLPKRIAGMKVPKALRKSGAKASTWLTSSTGREILAAGMVAAAATMTNKKARAAVNESARDAVSSAGRIGQALAETAADMMRRTVGGNQRDRSEEAGSGTGQAIKRSRKPAQPSTH
jgi:hypothetical protein